MYEPAHVAITFQLLEMSSITTPNQPNSNISTRYIFKGFFKGKYRQFLLIYIMKKINLEVLCNGIVLVYWNSCKHLPNLVNVAALLATHFCSILISTMLPLHNAMLCPGP